MKKVVKIVTWMWGIRVLSLLIMVIRSRVKEDDEHTDYLLYFDIQ